MKCNLDERGQKVRRIWGGLNILAAVGLAIWAFLGAVWWLYLIAAFCLASGAFAFWEARKKWCIVRAMGIKTPM